jgi:enoyl-CoA hydratase/carnithine racemase
MLNVSDDNRVRTLTLNRPDALNAFNEALYDSTAQALLTAADDPDVAVVVITGAGRAFSAGADLVEMQANITNPRENAGQHGFFRMLDVLSAFPKPLICAVNGVGVGIGATILGYADLAFMSSDARLKCPFTSLGVAPEAASSFLLPRQVGRQNAAWILMSSEWITAAEALEMGLVWKVCEPTELLAETKRHANVLASKPIPSLMAVKTTMTAPLRPQIDAAIERETACFAGVVGVHVTRSVRGVTCVGCPARLADPQLTATGGRTLSDEFSFEHLVRGRAGQVWCDAHVARPRLRGQIRLVGEK